MTDGRTPIPLRVRPSVEMATIIHKFEWAQKGEWSVSVTPEEAAIMSRLVSDYFHRLNYQPADPPPPVIGPPGSGNKRLPG